RVPALPAARRVAALARRVLHLAPAVDLRRGTPPSALAPPRRAPHLPRRRNLPLVAGRAREEFGRREGRLPLRRDRARVSARAGARADPARDLFLLRPRSTHLGPEPSRGPADRRRDDGCRGGPRLLRRLRRVLHALPRRRAGERAARRV